MQESKRYSAANTYSPFCVSKDTRIQTSTGTYSIEELYRAQEQGSRPDKVMTSYGLASYKEIAKAGKKKTYKITTSRGYSIETSGDHLFMIINSCLNSQWIKAKDLTVGAVLNLYQSDESVIGFDPIAYLAGLYYGDGSTPSDYNKEIS